MRSPGHARISYSPVRLLGERRRGRAAVPRSARSAGECSEHTVAEVDLLLDRERRVTEDALVELAGSTESAAPVREHEVVEDEHLAWTHGEIDFHCVQSQTAFSEELELVGQARELVAAKKFPVRLDARQDRDTAEGGLEDPGKAAFDITGCIRNPGSRVRRPAGAQNRRSSRAAAHHP